MNDVNANEETEKKENLLLEDILKQEKIRKDTKLPFCPSIEQNTNLCEF